MISDEIGDAPWDPLPRWLLRGEGPRLTPIEFRFVAFLWSLEYGREYAAPKITDLADLAGIKERRTRAILDGLVERGVLKRERPARRKTNRYRVRTFVAEDRSERSLSAARTDPERHSSAAPERHSSAAPTESSSTESRKNTERAARGAASSPSTSSRRTRSPRRTTNGDLLRMLAESPTKFTDRGMCDGTAIEES